MIDIIVRAVPCVKDHIAGALEMFLAKTQHVFSLYVICDEKIEEAIRMGVKDKANLNRMTFSDATDNISKDFNRVASHSKRDHILFTTGGVMVTRDWSEAFVRFCSSADVAAATPRLITPTGDIVNAGVIDPLKGVEGLRGFGLQHIASHYGVAEYCVSVLDDFMFVRRKVFNAVGPFNEQYVEYFNEHDWCRRAIKEFKLKPYYVSTELIICDGKVSGYGTEEWIRDKRIYTGEVVPEPEVVPEEVNAEEMLATANRRGRKARS